MRIFLLFLFVSIVYAQPYKPTEKEAKEHCEEVASFSSNQVILTRRTGEKTALQRGFERGKAARNARKSREIAYRECMWEYGYQG